MLRALILPAVTAASFPASIMLGQATHISETSNVTLGLVSTIVVFAFGLGVLVTSIKRDIKELRKTVDELPCVRDHGKNKCRS